MAIHDTPATFSTDEARQIREMAADPERPLACPRCREALRLTDPIERNGATLREASCPGCHRCIMLRNG